MIHFRHYLLCKHTLLLSIDKLRHLEPEIQDILQHEGREYRLEQVLPDPPIQQHQPLHQLHQSPARFAPEEAQHLLLADAGRVPRLGVGVAEHLEELLRGAPQEGVVQRLSLIHLYEPTSPERQGG